jgi:hypothetical protein
MLFCVGDFVIDIQALGISSASGGFFFAIGGPGSLKSFTTI